MRVADPSDDQQLVRRAQAGSEDAISELVRRFQRPVFTLILRMVRDPATAEDLAQEAFVNAFRHLHRFDPERRFASWLFKIAHNRTLDHLRRKRLDTISLEGPEEGMGVIGTIADERSRAPDQQHLRGEVREAFEAALAELRPEYQTVIVLRFQESLAYREIAEITGLPLATVKTHIHRARKALVASLEAAGFTPKQTSGSSRRARWE